MPYGIFLFVCFKRPCKLQQFSSWFVSGSVFVFWIRWRFFGGLAPSEYIELISWLLGDGGCYFPELHFISNCKCFSMKCVHLQAHIRPVPNVMNSTSEFCGVLQLFVQILSMIYKSILVLFLTKLLDVLQLRLYFTIDGVSL